ncbi:MAG: DUF2946 domain-containing protein [Gallionella sp.]|nr:DUF2946 domain-containing protein [Gallionella sp.]
MSRPIRKFIALLLAIWLPLFSGNALAGVIAMQSKGEDCHAAVTQQNEHRSHHAQNTPVTAHAQHEQLAANPDISSSGQHDQTNSSCKNHAICHLACCGYMANSVLMTVAKQQPGHAFTPYLVTLYTLTLPLFDPPPLARA